jgi:hypothetical protein
MKRGLDRWFSSVLVCGIVLFGFGCQENSASLVIIQNQVPGEGCTVQSSEGGDYRPQGKLDVSWYSEVGEAASYYMFPLVKNNLISTADEGAVEENCITIKETQVDLDLGAMGQYVESNFTKYAVPTAVTICPGEMRAVSVMVVPPQVVSIIASQVPENGMEYVSAKIRMVGKRGATTIKSNSMTYPIFVCNGCLIKNLGNCDTAVIPDDPAPGNPCNPAQDDPLECCIQGVDWVCPATTESTEEPSS